MGEAGMSLSANSLTLGCDRRGEIFYFDDTLNDLVGKYSEVVWLWFPGVSGVSQVYPA